MSFDVTTASTDYLTKNSYPVGFNSVYTTMFWWNFEGSTGSYQLLWYGWSADDAAYDGVGIDSGDTLLRGECYGGATETTSTGGSLTSGNWYHIAVVRESATSLKFYLDGALTITLTDNVGSRAAQTKEELLAVLTEGFLTRQDLNSTEQKTFDRVDKSNLRILELPKAGVKYILSVDATQSTDTTTKSKKTSKFAITVMKGVDPQSPYQFCPIATYITRPKDFDEVFDEAILMMRFWNQYDLAQFCGELNATGTVLAEKLIKAGFRRKLIVRKKLTKEGVESTSNLWYHRVTATIDWQYLQGNTYIKLYWENIYFIDLLLDMQKPYDANTDFLDSFLGCIWGFGTGDLLGELKEKEEKPKVVHQRRKMVEQNGVSVYVYENVTE